MNWEREWSVDLTLENERPQPGDDGVAIDIIRAQHIIESNSAHEAINDTVAFLCTHYGLVMENVTVTKIDIVLALDRE